MTSQPVITHGTDARGPLFELNADGFDATVVASTVEATASRLEQRPVVWIDHPDRAAGDLNNAMAERGFSAERDLWLMDVDLPLDTTTDLTVRSFRLGEDEPRWVEVNNRAFAWHREQGGWSVADLEARQQDDWFDADGFLVHDIDDQLAAFCWTKIHPDETPPAGEIYVIGVDPDHHGRGLGRAMTVAGLMSIAARGFRRGLLYVDADNIPAVRLYESMGFSVRTVRRLYVSA